MCNHMPVSTVDREPPGCCLIEILLRGFNRAPQFERLSVCGLGAIKSFPLHARISLSLSLVQKCGSNRARLNLNSFVKCCSKFSTTLSKNTHTHTGKLIWFIWPKTTHRVLPPGRRQHYILFFPSFSFFLFSFFNTVCLLLMGRHKSFRCRMMNGSHAYDAYPDLINYVYVYLYSWPVEVNCVKV